MGNVTINTSIQHCWAVMQASVLNSPWVAAIYMQKIGNQCRLIIIGEAILFKQLKKMAVVILLKVVQVSGSTVLGHKQ